MKKTVLALTLLGTMSTAHAELMSTDWLTENDQLATLDTETGLEWLDLSETNHMSIADVKLELEKESGQFQGWRLPTKEEVVRLLKNSFDILNNYYDNTSIGASFQDTTSRLQGNAFATYFSKTTEGWSLGMYENEDRISQGGNHAGYDSIYMNYGSLNESYSNRNYGVFLVSNGGTTLSSKNNPIINNIGFTGNPNEISVPLPMSLGLFTLGLGILTSRKKIKAKQ